MKDISRMENDRNYLSHTINRLNLDEITQEYIAHYLLYAEKQTRKAKLCYYIFTCITVICPILVLTIEQIDPRPMEWPDYLVMILTLCSTVGASLLSVFRFHDRWCHFRSYLERGIQILIDAKLIENDTDSGNILNNTELLNEFKRLNAEEQRQWQHLYNSKSENKQTL